MGPRQQIPRARKAVYVAAIAIGLSVGGAGIAAALTAGSGGSAAPASAGTDNDVETNDGPEDNPGEAAQERAYTEAHRGEASVSQTQAEAAALAVKPGRAFDTHLQTEDGVLVWEVKSDDGNTVWEVQVDPRNGAVVHIEVDD